MAKKKIKKKKPDNWLNSEEFKNIKILDPDGWDRQAEDWDKEWNTPLTKKEMWGKVLRSTITSKFNGWKV